MITISVSQFTFNHLQLSEDCDLSHFQLGFLFSESEHIFDALDFEESLGR